MQHLLLEDILIRHLKLLSFGYWQIKKYPTQNSIQKIAPRGDIFTYRTMYLKEAEAILDGNILALRGHLGDLKQAYTYYDVTKNGYLNGKMILRFKLSDNANSQLFDSAHMATNARGRGTQNIHAYLTATSNTPHIIK